MAGTRRRARVPLVVVGAHRKGQPLAHQLETLGAAWDGHVRTAARYRMVSLDTQPPKPGVYRSEDGAELVAERWLLSEAALGKFLAALPEPMLLGSVRLSDGSSAVGFACDAVAATSGTDITGMATGWLRSLYPSPGGTVPETTGSGEANGLKRTRLHGKSAGRTLETPLAPRSWSGSPEVCNPGPNGRSWASAWLSGRSRKQANPAAGGPSFPLPTG